MGRFLQAFVLCYIVAVCGAAAQSLDDWLKVPIDESALLVQISDMKGRVFHFTDEKGEKLDTYKWESELPFIQQYYLPAGEYDLKLPTGDPATELIRIVLKPGAYTYLDIVPATDEKPAMVQLTNWYGGYAASEAAAGKIEGFKKLGYDIQELRAPLSIKPNSNTILFNTDLPWKPPPPPPK